jgi:hypothetical protein
MRPLLTCRREITHHWPTPSGMSMLRLAVVICDIVLSRKGKSSMTTTAWCFIAIPPLPDLPDLSVPMTRSYGPKYQWPWRKVLDSESVFAFLYEI